MAREHDRHERVLTSGDRRRLVRLLDRFIEAPTWRASKAILERHPELVGDAAAELIDELAEAAREHQEQDVAKVYGQYRAVLRRCVADGVERAFAELLAAEEDDSDDDVALINRAGEDALRRYWNGAADADLQAAVAAFQSAVDRLPSAAPDRPAVLSNLGLALTERHARHGDGADIQRAVVVLEEAVAATSPETAERPACLANLGNALLSRYQACADLDDLQGALNVLQEAVTRMSHHVTGHAIVLNNLGSARQARYARFGHEEDLQQAVTAFGEAVAAVSSDAFERSKYLTNLGISLSERHARSGDLTDLDRAIEAYRDSVQLAPSKSPDRCGQLANLGTGLAERYARFGRPADLDSAVAAFSEAVDLTPVDSPDVPGRLANLGTGLRDRYSRSGDLNDLDQAVDAHERAVALTSAASPDMSIHLDSLGTTLRTRAVRTSSLADLMRAVSIHERAVTAAEVSSPDRAAFLNNLAGALRARFNSTRDPLDLDRAITVYREARDLFAAGSPEQAATLGNLGTSLLSRYATDEDSADLDQSVEVLRQAVNGTDQGAPDLPGRLNNLANGLRVQHSLTGNPDHLAQAVEAYRGSCQRSQEAGAEAGLMAARNWGEWASRRGAWPEAVEAYGYGFQGIERLFRSQLLRRHKETWLLAARGLSAGAAYALARTGDHNLAAVVLERGRALLLSEVLQRDRANLERLESSHAVLVDQYREAAALVDSLDKAELARPRTLLAPSARISELRAARQQLDATVAEIRKVVGYERFLEAPTIEDLREAAEIAPVVYLAATELGGLALVVGARVEAVWLSGLTEAALHAKVEDYASVYRRWNADGEAHSAPWSAALESITGWLWDVAMGQVVAALRPAARAVLVPLGLLGLLPLHAAWTHDPAAPTERRYLLDDLLLTYVPNARTAIAAATLASRTGVASSLLVVEEPTPVHGPALPGTALEAEGAIAAFGPAASLRIRHGDASRSAVLAALRKASVLHFACHGFANREEPLDSSLVLAQNELLTLRDLLAQRLEARLAVLSACETGLVDPQLPDEVIGLPTGLLQAGVAGVVGSLWPVVDARAMLVMVDFYQRWRRQGVDPPDALRLAQQWLRDVTNGWLRDAYATAAQGFETDWPPASIASGVFDAVVLEPPMERPFAHPRNWAAFAYFGV